MIGTGFRKKKRQRKARPDEKVIRENPTATLPQVYARIPGHDLAEVVEMVYRYKGRRRKLDHIIVTWPNIGPNRRRFQMTPLIRLKKRRRRPWWYKKGMAGARMVARLIVTAVRFFKPAQTGREPFPHVIHPADLYGKQN